jgi:hypothetical protein
MSSARRLSRLAPPEVAVGIATGVGRPKRRAVVGGTEDVGKREGFSIAFGGATAAADGGRLEPLPPDSVNTADVVRFLSWTDEVLRDAVIMCARAGGPRRMGMELGGGIGFPSSGRPSATVFDSPATGSTDEDADLV